MDITVWRRVSNSALVRAARPQRCEMGACHGGVHAKRGREALVYPELCGTPTPALFQGLSRGLWRTWAR